ncbi:transcriptional regulator [Alkalihalophilus pseudofirmus]|uniref:RsfA family transcriptional regulator n=1 Tax=Alkalihalophilus pseudofirmus TaxID=79885 RepID=A0AAJ2NN27_ALKPS|nr:MULTISPECIES: RsfA family transcriptional regulator [Alkalihalophilus]MDV2885386.1 RsfA family transcriptional regulator [Alkalihalophilus pseudofirmus]MED1602175.1 RsfA family transcriptional regulator [Alkalihalophilus marmarensis]OLS37372.1 transcriptional regulator [Alkalihalophilus pseudofirmus]WEG15727.1 RsfA family transcriptional regulator [Alkalihalophilus pseudofirmus]
MTTIRQDAWSTDEDLILAEVVLRHIREGSTQLAAFEEVGERLSRTSAACGFRWNSAIRKKYESAISLAKKQRSKAKVAAEPFEASVEEEIRTDAIGDSIQAAEPHSLEEKDLTMEKVITFLEAYHQNDKSIENVQMIKRLESENAELIKKVERLEKEKRIIAEDYKALIGIMDRARQLSFYDQEPRNVARSTK